MLAFLRNTLFGALASVLLVSAAHADDWLAGKLRGPVMQMVDGQWQPLTRGMVVPDDRIVRTMAAGYVTLTRGAETLDLGPNTQIQILDKAGKKPFTTVKQYFGSVSVEAEVRNVQHFAVDTPFLAAVVKGTRFTVVSGKTNSMVTVRRGHVAVENNTNKSHVLLSVGQSATVDGVKTNSIIVEGRGKLPAVLGSDGQPLISVGTSSDGTTVSVNAGNLVNIDAGSSGLNVNAAGVGLSLGKGSDNSGKDSGSNGSGSGHSGSGSSGSSGSGGGGKIVNVSVLGINVGL